MKRLVQLLLPAVLVALNACRSPQPEHSNGNNMAFDTVKYVKEFPIRYRLDKGTPYDPGINGVQDFLIHDTMMVFSTNDPSGYWAFLSMPQQKLCGRFLLKGNGPNEFLFFPYVNKETIYKQEGRLYMTVLNNIRHRLLRMDVDSTLRTGFLHVKVLEDSLPRSIFGFAYVNDTAFLCRTITNDETQQLRFYMENGRKRTPPHLEKLNEARIEKGGDFNYLSSIVKFNRERQMFVEASVAMNHINLYTYDGSKTRTICVGEKLDDIDELQRLPGWKMPYTYEHLCIYPRFFAALYLATTKKAFQTRTGHMPKIHIFDWEGAPLAEVELHHYATSFDIDFTAGELYVLDPETEDFYRYEIKELLTAIERVN